MEKDLILGNFWAIAEALDVDPLWLATGRKSADWVGEEERDLLELFRGLPDDLRGKLVEMAWMIRARFEAVQLEDVPRAVEQQETYGLTPAPRRSR